jgi:hypothetical protein
MKWRLVIAPSSQRLNYFHCYDIPNYGNQFSFSILRQISEPVMYLLALFQSLQRFFCLLLNFVITQKHKRLFYL